MAQQSARPATDGTSNLGELKIADLSHGQGLTDRYDQLLLTLCDTSAQSTDSSVNSVSDKTTAFCRHIRHALNADTAYLCSRNSLKIVATSSCNSTQQACEDTQELHTALTTMVSDLWNCTAPLCPPGIKVFPDAPNFSYCVIPLDNERDHLLVITNAEVDHALIGDYIADALTSLYNGFLSASDNTPATTIIEPLVLDALHRKYQLSSKVISTRRHELFCNQVKESVVEFEGLTLVKIKHKPDPLQTKLPASLYDIAALWDKATDSNETAKFKATLDNHHLVESVYGYKTLCDNENLAKFSEGRLLKIRIHGESLSDYRFIETLRDLTEKAVIHSSKIEFSILPAHGKDFTDALHRLCDRFNIPTQPVAVAPNSSVSIADEFDMMQLHGVKRSATVRKIKS